MTCGLKNNRKPLISYIYIIVMLMLIAEWCQGFQFSSDIISYLWRKTNFFKRKFLFNHIFIIKNEFPINFDNEKKIRKLINVIPPPFPWNLLKEIDFPISFYYLVVKLLSEMKLFSLLLSLGNTLKDLLSLFLWLFSRI